ncbi:Clp protease N-terminal domain-containing protein [Microbispora corallina]|uniref:Clp protease n=1 Tax=Microbispora corallina TaxID=83302 RepID=A0ABQ4G0H9_9ACTN|nr:Clp protease N-terminal domain-containing protein [Microbispora corallina]GIH40571.1 Clp protease [Microbispora corallina]
MFERFTETARKVLVLGQENARRLRHDHLGTEHLLLGLLGQPESLSARLLGGHGLDHERAYAAVVRILGTHPTGDIDADALESIGIDLAAVREKVEAAFGPGALDRRPGREERGVLVGPRRIPLTPRAKKVLELSLREALALGSKDIRDGHILLGLIREGEGLGVRVMTDAGLDLAGLRTEVRAGLG